MKNVKSKIKVNINKSKNPYLYNVSISNSNSNSVPSYGSIKSTIYKHINKGIPLEPEDVENISADFPGFLTDDNKPSLLYRDKDLIILESSNILKY